MSVQDAEGLEGLHKEGKILGRERTRNGFGCEQRIPGSPMEKELSYTLFIAGQRGIWIVLECRIVRDAQDHRKEYGVFWQIPLFVSPLQLDGTLMEGCPAVLVRLVLQRKTQDCKTSTHTDTYT